MIIKTNVYNYFKYSVSNTPKAQVVAKLFFLESVDTVFFLVYGATFLESNTKQEYSNCKIGVKYQIKYEIDMYKE